MRKALAMGLAWNAALLSGEVRSAASRAARVGDPQARRLNATAGFPRTGHHAGHHQKSGTAGPNPAAPQRTLPIGLAGTAPSVGFFALTHRSGD